MVNQQNACLTFDGACDAAIDMEGRVYQHFLQAIRLVRDEAAVAILRDAAIDRLQIKHKLEEAALKGKIDQQSVQGRVPTMELLLNCCDPSQIDAKADNRKALAFAIQLSKDALKFYRDMADECSGAPMAELFTVLGDDQTRILQQLEYTYEEHFLPEN